MPADGVRGYPGAGLRIPPAGAAPVSHQATPAERPSMRRDAPIIAFTASESHLFAEAGPENISLATRDDAVERLQALRRQFFGAGAGCFGSIGQSLRASTDFPSRSTVGAADLSCPPASTRTALFSTAWASGEAMFRAP